MNIKNNSNNNKQVSTPTTTVKNDFSNSGALNSQSRSGGLVQ